MGAAFWGRAVKLDKNLHIVGDVYDTGKKQIIEPDRDGN